MRIISKFKDYYDSAASFGIDLEYVYNREQKEIEFKKVSGNNVLKKYPQIRGNIRGYDISRDSTVTHLNGYVLGFCGHIMPVIKVEFKKDTSNTFSEKENIFFYDYDSYIDFLKKNNVKFSGYYSSYYYRNEIHFDILHEIGAKDFFNHHYNELRDLFVEHHTPLFLYTDTGEKQKVQINPSLKDLKFGQVKDAHTCFQEIFMYLSGVLGSVEKDLVQISDKDMLKQKGFDHWSFKKMPTKHK